MPAQTDPTQQANELRKAIELLRREIEAADSAAKKNELGKALKQQEEAYARAARAAKDLKALAAAAPANPFAGLSGPSYATQTAAKAAEPRYGPDPAKQALYQQQQAEYQRSDKTAATPSGAADALAAINPAAGLVVKGFASLVHTSDTLRNAFGPFAQLVQQFNPGLVLQFQRALEDLQASLGNIFEPLIEAGIRIADTFNALYTAIGPVFKPAVEAVADVLKELAAIAAALLRPALEALAPVVRAVAAGLRPLLTALTPIFNELGRVVTAQSAYLARAWQQLIPVVVQLVEAFAPLLTELVPLAFELSQVFTNLGIELVKLVAEILPPLLDAFKAITRALASLVGWIRDRLRELGIGSGSAASASAPDRLNPNDRTTAARQARISSVEEIGRTARVAAFSSRSAADRTADATERSSRLLEEIARNTGGAVNASSPTVRQLASLAPQSWLEAAARTAREGSG